VAWGSELLSGASVRAVSSRSRSSRGADSGTPLVLYWFSSSERRCIASLLRLGSFGFLDRCFRHVLEMITDSTVSVITRFIISSGSNGIVFAACRLTQRS